MPRRNRAGAGEDASEASDTFPQKCSALRKNGFAVLRDKPCKIVEMSTASPGKHGHAKVHFVGLDIFTGKKVEDIHPSTHNMQVPVVNRREYEVLGVDSEGYFSLMNDSGELRSDLKLTAVCNLKEKEDFFKLKEKVEEDTQAVIATVWTALGKEAVKEVKLGKPL